MRRREFIALVGGAAVCPLAAWAQRPSKVWRIGSLGLAREASLEAALWTGLRDLGYVEGKNIIIEFRYAGKADQLPRVAAELVSMNVDVIFANSSTYVEPARQATSRIPIVFATHADPVGVGHVASLSRPGGNVTGLSMLMTDLAVKVFELLKEAVPHARRVGVLWNPSVPSHAPALQAVESAAQQLSVQLLMVPARTIEDFDGALAKMAEERVDGFLVVAAPSTYLGRAPLAELAIKHRLPGVYSFKENVVAGGLMSYGADIHDLFRRAAAYIDKILKGDNPGDLPVEQASKYELAINLKTAKALGLTIPQSLLIRADEVVE